jgi:hypothetical protein
MLDKIVNGSAPIRLFRRIILEFLQLLQPFPHRLDNGQGFHEVTIELSVLEASGTNIHGNLL